MDTERVLKRLEREWQAFQATWQDLPENMLLVPGVVGQWSVRDLLAHITTWEKETLKVLPIILTGKRSPRYGDVDAFNEREHERKRGLSLYEIKRELSAIHACLLHYLTSVPEVTDNTADRFLRRLRLDTYNHYREHAAQIREWRVNLFPP